jgi:prepilin-type N-terminal cleavage/methylation domain-containing protein
MRFASIGTPEASRSARRERLAMRSSGFTLIEALVALALLVAFVAVSGPLMFQSRRILARGDGEVRAELLLRSVLNTPERPMGAGVREGQDDGFLWRVTIEPAIEETAPPPTSADAPPYRWSLYQVVARVSWGAGKVLTARALRLGKAEP